MIHHDKKRPWLDLVFAYEFAISAEARRVTTLQVLGIIALGTGLLIALTAPSSGTSLVLFSTLLWWPWLTGLALAAAGLLLTVGAFTPYPRLALAGSMLSVIWYAWFGLGFTAQWLQWMFAGHVPQDEPPIYPTAVYLGLAALHVLNASGVREHMGPKKT